MNDRQVLGRHRQLSNLCNFGMIGSRFGAPECRLTSFRCLKPDRPQPAQNLTFKPSMHWNSLDIDKVHHPETSRT